LKRDPANARRQALERDAFLCEHNPAAQMYVVRKEPEQFLVASRDVRRFAGKRREAKWTAALTE
jgi:hypothetical protein